MSWAEVKVLRDKLSRFGHLENTITSGQTREDLHLPNLPVSISNYSNSPVTVYENKIHLISGASHYSWDGTSWTSEPRLPLGMDEGMLLVVCNEKLHAIGRRSGYSSYLHYMLDGESWQTLSSFDDSYGTTYTGAVVYQDEIHIIGQNSSPYTGHIAWNGTSWVTKSTLPTVINNSARAIVYRDEIHLFGDYSGATTHNKHYIWNGVSWRASTNTPYKFNEGYLFVIDDKLHIAGGVFSGTAHYSWDGTSWTSEPSLPIGMSRTGGFAVYNEKVNLFSNNSHYEGFKTLNNKVAFGYTGQIETTYIPQDCFVYCNRNLTRVEPVYEAEVEPFDEGYKITKAGIVKISQIDDYGQYFAIG